MNNTRFDTEKIDHTPISGKRVAVALMTTLIFLLSGLSGRNIAVAQQPPADKDTIFQAIINAHSPYYYPTLMMRYQAGDSTLNNTDFFYLYYGYAYQDEYRPLEPVKGEDQLLTILAELNDDQITKEQADELLYYAQQVMAADPFSPKNINFMIYAYGLLGDTINERMSAERLVKVLKAIESSGDGLKESTPRHVLWFSHATDFLAAQGLEPQKRTIRTKTVEYITLKERDGNVKGYFFDFGRVYWRRPDVIPKRERRVTGFELNGIRIGQRKDLYAPSR